MRCSASILLLAAFVTSLQAAVYRGDAFNFPQPDGSQVAVRIWGDEFSIVSETPEGWAIVQDAGGWWCYARMAGDSIAASALRVGAGNPATLGVAKHLRPSAAQRKAVADVQRTRLSRDERGRPDSPVLRAARSARLAAAPAPSDKVFAPGNRTTGFRTGVTLLVRFPDRLADATITNEQVNLFCNGIYYNEFGNNGSVAAYFLDNSLGRLLYTNIVRDYHTASRDRTYYAQVNPAAGTDPVGELILEALDAADAAGFDFRQCDGNNDGVIDGVNILYAGACPNGWAQGLWPHMGTITWTSDDGMRTGSYQVSDMPDSLSIGTFCHENGHMLCDFPDIYDYDFDSIGGAGFFSLMNSGGHGPNPARVDGYLALSAGWRDPVDLYGSTSGTYTVEAESASIFRYRKPGSTSEYFLIENRWTGSASARDSFLPCSGLAIWHCDELGDHNDQRYKKNVLNRNYEVALVQADDLRDFERGIDKGDSGDLWYSGNPSLNYDDNFDDGNGVDPRANDARWWDGTASGLDLSEFSVPGQTMSFTFAMTRLSLTSATYTAVEGNSGTTTAQIQVTRTGSRKGPATLNWSTADGSATVAGRDYRAASGTVTWASDQMGVQSFSIPILGDTMTENDETVAISVSSPAAGVPVTIATAALSIANDDAAIPFAGSLELTTYEATVTEGSTGGVTYTAIPVRRRGGSAGAVSVTWRAVGSSATAGTDFTATTGTLNWAAGDASDQFIRVPIAADADPENDETLTVTLGPAIGGAIAPTPNQVVVTILNDDCHVGFVSSTLNILEPAIGTSTGAVVVRQLGAIHGTISVDYRWVGGTATPGLDYVQKPAGTLTWTTGSMGKAISLPVYADSERDGGETVMLVLENPVGATLLEPSSVTIVINDYQPSGSIGAPSGTASGSPGQGGMCGAGGVAGLICLGGIGFGLLRRRRR